MVRHTLLALLMALTVACADPAARVREGHLALQAGRHERALQLLDEAVRELPGDHPQALPARRDLCLALAHIDPGLSVTAFERLLLPQVDEPSGAASRLIGELLDQEAPGEAGQVVELLIQRCGASAKLRELEAIAARRLARRPPVLEGFVCWDV